MGSRRSAGSDRKAAAELRHARSNGPGRSIEVGEANTIVVDSDTNVLAYFFDPDFGEMSARMPLGVPYPLQEDLDNVLDHRAARDECGFDPELSADIGD